LKLDARATATLSGGGRSATLRGAGTFVVGASGKSFVQAESGGITVTESTTEVTVDVPGGSIVAKIGAACDVQAKSKGSHVSVRAGTAEVRTETGTETLHAGEEASLVGTRAEVLGRGIGYSDLVVTAGESFAVHDPGPPTAIGFSAKACASGTAVELASGAKTLRASASGADTVSVLVPSGFYRYTVRCIEKEAVSDAVAAKGTISVLADSGTARLPHSAPAAFVDTDGRTYTVLYQSLLPTISVHWPGAPKAAAYHLEVASGSGATRSITASGPAYSFVSGALTEGLHRFTFSVPGGARSPQTVLDVRFDNGAPAATLISPANGSVAPGATTVVSGSASEGFKVSAFGRELPMDGQLRFSGEVTVPAGRHALAIRFAHPSRGIHYYLRRVAPQ
jgi:hypothetical protein